MEQSLNDTLGQIGAAKIFTSSVSTSLGDTVNYNKETIAQLEEQLQTTTDANQRSKIQKQIKRLKRKNAVSNGINVVTSGATDVLLKLAEYADIGKREIIQFIAKVIAVTVPEMEIATKMLLLTNFKKMISCSINPYIPDEWRSSGVTVNINEIDPRQLLVTSPYSTWGRYQYFGVYCGEWDLDGVPVHALARADDMNAFIWYAKNCALYTSSLSMQTVNSTTNKITGDLSDYFDENSGATLYDQFQFIGNNEKANFLPGCTFKQTNLANTIFLCTKKTEDNPPQYTIVPCSDSYCSVNWYKDRDNVFKSKPLFNLEFSHQFNNTATFPTNNFRFKILPKPFQLGSGFVAELGNVLDTMDDVLMTGYDGINKLMGDDVSSKNDSGSYKFPGFRATFPYTARFGREGKYNKKGQFSIDENRFNVVVRPVKPKGEKSKLKTILHYSLYYKNGSQSKSAGELIFDTKTKVFYLSSEAPSETLPHGEALEPALASKLLSQCYFGKTVYEFNYDYLMSFRLFDAKVITANIVNALMGIPIPFSKQKGNDTSDDTSLSNTDQLLVDNYIDKMVQNIIAEQQTEDTEFVDCFYTFSNEEYAQLEAMTNEKAIKGTLQTYQEDDGINETYNLLDSYNTSATLQEQTETLEKIFTKVYENTSNTNNTPVTANGTTTASLGSEENNADTFIQKAVKVLTTEVVNALLTPKVLLLIQINQKLMGDNTMIEMSDNGEVSVPIENYKISISDILNGLQGTLNGVIKEIINTIQKELLRVIMNQLSITLSAYAYKLSLEYAEKWKKILAQLLQCFKLNKNNLSGNSNSQTNNGSDAIKTILDNIEGADIDALSGELLPNTNKC